MTLLLDDSEINTAARIIRRGGIVAFPTETVYGLGADATNAEAVEKIFNVKGRPAVNPLIVHFESLDDLFLRIPDIDINTKKVLQKIKDALTVIIPRPDWIPAIVSAGLDTVAVRVPSEEIARKFIKACGVPLAAPSANISGRPSPTRWQHVYADFKDKIDAVFTCDPTRIGVESTVIQVTSNKEQGTSFAQSASLRGEQGSTKQSRILVLRLGGVSTTQLTEATSLPVVVASASHEAASASPGTRFKHYAPTCKMVVAKYGPDMTARIQTYIKGKKATVMFWQGKANDYLPNIVCLGRTTEEITRNLYTSIRAAEFGSDVIVCEGFPDTPEYETLNERISRASEGHHI